MRVDGRRIVPDGLVAVALGVFLSRLPFLSAISYGADPDAWRIVAAGAHVAERGMYVVSRVPGNPLVEAQAALLWALGLRSPVVFGLVGAAWSALAAATLALLLRDAGASRPALAGFAFAFVPIVYTESVTAMDSLPATALGALALTAAYRNRAGWAGLAVGLAIGCRLSALLWVVPVAVLLGQRIGWRAMGRMACVAALAAIAVWLPVLRAYGLDAFRFSDGGASLQHLIRRGTLEVWGLLGLGALALALLAFVVRRQPSPDRTLSGALLTGALLFGVAFLRLPLEPAYLLPAVPPFVGLLALHLRPGAFVLVAVLLVLSPFAFDLEAKGALPLGREPHIQTGSPVVFTLAGPLFHDTALRRADASRAAAMLATLPTLSPGSVMVAGTDRPRIVGTALRTGRPLPSGLAYAWPEPRNPRMPTADAAWLAPLPSSPTRLYCAPGVIVSVPCLTLPLHAN